MSTTLRRHVSPEFHVCAAMEGAWGDSEPPELKGKTNSTNFKNSTPWILSPYITYINPTQIHTFPKRTMGTASPALWRSRRAAVVQTRLGIFES